MVERLSQMAAGAGLAAGLSAVGAPVRGWPAALLLTWSVGLPSPHAYSA